MSTEKSDHMIQVWLTVLSLVHRHGMHCRTCICPNYLAGAGLSSPQASAAALVLP